MTDVALGLAAATIEPQGVRIGAIISLLRRRAALILLFALIGALAAVSFSMSQPKLYTSSGKITIAGQVFAIPELQGALRGNNGSDPMLVVRTEVQALSSRQLVQQVSDELHFANTAEFNPALRPPGLASVLIDHLWHHSTDQFAPSAAFAVEDDLFAVVSRNLLIFNDNHSLVIEITFTSSDPQRSADFTNTLIRDYIAMQATQRSAADQDANSTLVRRIDSLNHEISILEQQIADIHNKSQIVALRAGSVSQQQLEELALQATRASLERSELQSTWQRATALARNGTSDELAAVLSSQTVSRLREQESLAARQVAALSTRYGSGFPELEDAKASLESARRLLSREIQRIIASLTTQLEVAREHEANAQGQLDAAREESIRTENVQAKLENLKQEIADRRVLSQNLLARTQQTTIRSTAEQTPDVRVLSKAFPSASPSSPRTGLAGLFGLLAGMILGVLTTIVTARGSGPASVDKISQIDGLPILAVLSTTACGSASPARGATPLIQEASEALRTLRSRIRLNSRSEVPRVVAFIAEQRSQAATGLPVAFARLAAVDGERVLLIDGNLTAPSLTALMSSGGRFAEVLAGKIEWREAVLRDASSPLDVLGIDRPARDAYALLSGIRFQNMLVEARQEYNLIVISAPPAFSASEALVIAHRADTSVIVFNGIRSGHVVTGTFIDDVFQTSAGPVAAVLIAP